MRPWAPAILALLAAGCVPGPVHGLTNAEHAPTNAVPDERQRLACAADEEPAHLDLYHSAWGELASGERIAAIRIEGQRSVPEALIREALRVQAGAPLDTLVLARDARALSALGVFEEVRVEAERRPEGLTLTYQVTERPFVERVFVEGERPEDAGTWFFPVPGDVFDGAAVKRAGVAIAWRLVYTGHLDAAVHTHARRVGERAVDLCLGLSPGPVYHVRKVAFTGNRVLSAAELRKALAEALPETDRGKMNVEGGVYRADLIERARLFVSALAYERGLLRFEGADPEVKIVRISPAEGSVEVTFPIEEGPVFHLAAVGFSGALAAPKAAYEALIDVHPGEIFSRSKMVAVKERAEAMHHRLGREDLTVEPRTDLDGEHVRVDFHVEASR